MEDSKMLFLRQILAVEKEMDIKALRVGDLLSLSMRMED